MIDAKFIEQNRKKLLEEKKRLETLLSRIAKKDETGGDYHPEFPEFGNKEDENASEVATYAANIAEEFDLQEKLRKVNTALTRIENGKYGICMRGGEEMPRARLEAVPEAGSCVEHEPR